MPFPPGTKGAIRVKYVLFDPTDIADIPNGALTLDSNNADSLTVKNTDGGNAQVGEASGSNLNFSSFRNMSGITIPANMPVSMKPDGTIILGKSDGVNTYRIIGLSNEEILNGAYGSVHLMGTVKRGALDTLGFISADPIYLGDNNAYINNLNSLTGDNDNIIRLGFALPATGTAVAAASDLLLFAEVVGSEG